MLYIEYESGEQMVIEIDIKIEDSDGRVLHRFENRFDEQDNSLDTQEYHDSTDKDFDEFLSEYLSYSGYLLREKLFSGLNSTKAKKAKTVRKNKTKKLPDTDKVIGYEDSELEYRIRIGDDKVLIGRIPLKLEPSTSNVKLLLCSEDGEMPHNIEANSSNDPIHNNSGECTASVYTEYASTSHNLDSEFNDVDDTTTEYPTSDYTAINLSSSNTDTLLKSTSSEKEEAELDNILNFAMIKAIQKYESNLSPGWDEMNLAQVETD